jgi:hypothetical protein
MRHLVKFCIYIEVTAEDEDAAYELAEKKLEELSREGKLFDLLDYEDTLQPD